MYENEFINKKVKRKTNYILIIVILLITIIGSYLIIGNYFLTEYNKIEKEMVSKAKQYIKKYIL